MEDDDEFGDLYTDVLLPFNTPFQSGDREATSAAVAPAGGGGKAASSSQTRPIDLNINSDDEEILYGAPDSKNSKSISNSGLGLDLNDPVQEKTLPGSEVRQETRKFDLNLESTSEDLAGNKGRASGLEARVLEKVEGEKATSLMVDDDDDDINIVVEERDNKDDNFITNTKDDMYGSGVQKENAFHFGNGNEVGTEQMIPGISGRLENPGGSNFEDEWESEDSEDDLQIVLNDNHGPMGMEGMPGVDDDEDGEPLVIVADNGDLSHHHHNQRIMMDEQEWVGEEGGPGADGERKELGDATKANGGAGGTAAQAVAQPKLGYSSHAYHPSFHSQFKYVRPGAAPIPGAPPVTPGGIPGQVRPPFPMGPLGRGRGDWRPTGIKGDVSMQKGFHPGLPAWGTNSAGRGYGSGLDFTLPSHKTIFEVDIDSFEEKPWKLPGIDMSDFFNFGLNEETWKDYRRQLEQLRLGTTMQNKIRVYESGRAEQDYDPDLPPELAAAVAVQDTPSESAKPGNVDAGITESASARGRQPLPVGRPIPVEISSSERLPSVDTRRQRMHDSDAVIEVVCHNPKDDEDTSEQQGVDLSGGEDVEGENEIDDLQQDDRQHDDPISHAYNGRKRESIAKRANVKDSVGSDEIVTEDVLHSSPEVHMRPRFDGKMGVNHDTRPTRGRGHVRSPKITARDNKREKEIMDDRDEESSDRGHNKQSPLRSSPIGSDREQGLVVKDDRSFDMEREEMAVDEASKDTLEDENLMRSTNKQKVSSRMENLSQENDDGEDSKGGRSSGNSKARSGSSKEHRKFRASAEDEVLQDRRPPRYDNRSIGDEDYARRKDRYERDETGRKHILVKGREGSHARGGGDYNSSIRRHVKSESADRRKESDLSEGSWHLGDDDRHGRRTRVEETRKIDHGGDIGSRIRGKVRESERTEREHHLSKNQLDNGSWKASNHSRDMGSRERDRDHNLKRRNETENDLQSKRRREGVSRENAAKEDIPYNHRESSSRRKRERDDVPDQWRRDDQARLKDDDVHYVRHKEEILLQRERNDRQREHDEWQRLKTHEEIIARREREEARVMRSGRAAEDKAWNSHSLRKDDYRGSSKEYYPADVGRLGNQLKRRDRVETTSFSKHRDHEDLYARGNQLNHDEKRARYERPGPRSERISQASDSSRVHESKPKQSSRRGKDSESLDHSSGPSKRNQDEQGGQISRTVNPRSRTERGSGKDDTNDKSKDEASSDEEQPDSRRGRSKLERWTSNKERDFAITSMSSSSLRNKDLDAFANGEAPLINGLPEESSSKVEDKAQPVVDDKDTGKDMNVNAKVTEDKHLDTVAKLKKRSERFKLPMPTGKDTLAIKKMETEALPSVQTEVVPAPEIKLERPARKRRWTGN